MRAVWTRLWKAMAVLVVVAAVVGGEFALFGDKLARNLDVLLARESGQPGGSRPPASLPVLAPPAAGPITQVELRPIGACQAGQACTVLMQVGVQPQSQPLRISWRLEIVDRCRQRRDRGPQGEASIPPGRDRLVETVAITLPPAISLAVIAVTSQPVPVAGRPMRLPGDDGPCPG